MIVFSEKVLPIILRNEGVVFDSKGRVTDSGYVNDPSDSGGETNYGITQKTYDASGGKSIKTITLPEVSTIYEQDYWRACKSDIIALTNPALAVNLCDCAINCGVGAAIRMLQVVLSVENDGVIGTNTFNAIANIDKYRVNAKYALARVSHYAHLAIVYPKNQKFLSGWILRSVRTFNESNLLGLV